MWWYIIHEAWDFNSLFLDCIRLQNAFSGTTYSSGSQSITKLNPGMWHQTHHWWTDFSLKQKNKMSTPLINVLVKTQLQIEGNTAACGCGRMDFWQYLEWMNRSVKSVYSCDELHMYRCWKSSQRWLENKPDGKDIWLQVSWNSRNFSATWQAVLLMEAWRERRRARAQGRKIWENNKVGWSEEETSVWKMETWEEEETQMKDVNHINRCCQMKTLHLWETLVFPCR